MKIHHQFDPPPDQGVGDFGPSLTRQEFLEESDINQIIKQYQTHGVLPDTRDAAPQYADLTDPAFTDYQAAMNLVLEADYAFSRLPAKVRERFGNDPASLILFVQDEKNAKEAHELGLLRDDYKSPSAPPEPKPPEAKP